MRRGLEAHQGAIDAQRAGLREVEQESAALQQRVQALATWRAETVPRLAAADDARMELQRHLETLVAQIAAELVDLRQAFLTTRGEFEAVRDGRVPALEGAAARLHHAVEAVQAELAQLAAVRVAQLEGAAAQVAAALAALQATVEAVDATRLPRLEEGVRGMADALGRVQAGLEELAAVRVAQLEGAAAQAAAALAALQATVEAVDAIRLPRLEEDARGMADALGRVQAGLEELAAVRVAQLEAATARELPALRTAWSQVQGEVLSLRDGRLPELQEGVAALQRGVSEVQGLGEELRDQRLPALAGRVDALLARLHEQLEVTAGLVDRLLAGEGLRIDTPVTVEAALPEALRTAHLAFLDEFRGEREETLGRVGEHVTRLTGQQPVLDLGCGRGELLEALRAAGIEARGVDADPAMVEACRRRGLAVETGDALEVLAAQPPASLGAVTALHLFEHLPAGRWAAIIQAAATALEEGGVLLVECPNPEALRVGANLFWIDPTHYAPVHREAAAFVMRALGLEVVENALLHPFPPEQLLGAPGLTGELRALAVRLDELLSGPRDWLLVARKPSRASAQGNSHA